MYNHSLFSADRATHLKIVVVPLIAVALLVVAALNTRAADASASNTVLVAGHAPAHYANSTSTVIR